jgi:hypothetical protein
MVGELVLNKLPLRKVAVIVTGLPASATREVLVEVVFS